MGIYQVFNIDHLTKLFYNINMPKEKKIEDIKLIPEQKPVPKPEAKTEKPETPEILEKPVSNKTLSWKKITLLGGIFLVVLGVGFIYARFSYTANQILGTEGESSFFEQIQYVSDEKPVKGELEDRINVLLLGLGGLNHPGGTLTDTMMVASFKPSTKEVALISIPRDMVVKIYDDDNPQWWEGRKINYTYELGGMDLTLEKVTEVTGLPLHYYVWVDFDGFRNLIDDVGGLDIYIDNGFTDYEFPDYNYGYQTIEFTQGWEHMQGERALQFARSRHGNHGEGSDFARSQRQQKILQAFKDKFFSTSTLLNPVRLNKIMEDLGAHLKTNAEVWEIIRAAQISTDLNADNIYSKVIDNSEGGLLYSEISSQTGAYVLIPQAGEYNYSEIRAFCRNVFEHSEVTKENATVEVQNGTKKNGLAAQTADKLKMLELSVTGVGNAAEQEHQVTKIYDLSNGEKPNALATLQEKLPTAKFLTAEAGQNLVTEKVDFLIILGQDQIENPLTIEDELEPDDAIEVDPETLPDSYVL